MAMKKTLLAIFGFVLLSALAATAGQYGDFTYSTDGSAVIITGYTGPGGTVAIPGTIDNLPVIGIGELAFVNNVSLASITIPASVTSIGSRAFKYCSSLASITIPVSVTRIGDRAFASCTNLMNITVDAANTSYRSMDGVLFNKGRTTILQCPGGKIGSYKIPVSVTSIGIWAFYGCTSLASIKIPVSVTSIGNGAFYNCSSLASITIPASVTSIGNGAFTSCTSLMNIAVDAANASYRSVDGVLFNKGRTTLLQCPGGKIGGYNIPVSVTSIEDGGFANCTSLASVTIPVSVTNIGNKAFSGCTSLASVFFYGNAPGVGINVFGAASNATVYYLPGTTGWEPTFAGQPAVLWALIIGPVIKANGSTNDAVINSSDNLSITVQLDPGQFAGTEADWWVVVCAGSSWFHMDGAASWTQEGAWRPVYQGGLFNLPAREVLDITGLGAGSYTFYFAVDFPMNGILDMEQLWVDAVTVTVQ